VRLVGRRLDIRPGGASFGVPTNAGAGSLKVSGTVSTALFAAASPSARRFDGIVRLTPAMMSASEAAGV